MYDPQTSLDSPSATSSPASESGHTPCAALGGLTVVQFGLALAPANLSATQAEAMGLLMSGISGRTSSNSSRSVALQLCLESRLRARTASRGSTLFKLTWRARSTPSGRQICALRASARRTSGNDCSLPRSPWPTPNARDFKCGPTETYAERSGTTKGDSLSNLVTAVCGSWATPKAADGRGEAYEPDPDCRRVEMRKQVSLASWAAPTTNDSLRSPSQDFAPTPNLTLNHMAVLAGWPTPMAGTPAQNGNNEAGNNDSSRRTVDLCTVPQGPARLTVTGQLLTGSSAETASGGQLCPGHSRWLMALPSAWDDCGVMAMQSLRKSPKPSSRRTLTSKE